METPKIDVPGVSFFFDQRAKRYRIQFYRKGRRKTITLETTHAGRAYTQAYEKAEAFNAGRYDPWSDAGAAPATIAEAVKQYLATIQNLSKFTVTHRTFILEAFRDSQPSTTLLRDVDAESLRDFYEAPRLKPASRRSYYNQLNTWLNWCVSGGLLTRSPLANVTRPSVPKGPPRYFTVEEFRALLNHTQKEVDRQLKQGGFISSSGIEDYPDMLRFAVESGLRRGEFLHLRWMDVDLNAGRLHVRAYTDKQRAVKFTPKHGKNRIVPLSPAALEILNRRRAERRNDDDTEAIFCNPNNGRPRSRGAVTKTISKLVSDAGLNVSRPVHALRHTFGSWLASSGVALARIQRWMGHASIKQTEVYADLLPSALEWQGSIFHEALPANSGASE